MQGWRKRQEDAHISALSKGESKNIDVLGVFDGHVGKEISQFVSNHFTEELIQNKNIDIFGVYMVIVEKKLFNSSQTILLMN